MVHLRLGLPSIMFIGGPGSSVGIAFELWAGQSGIECRWGRGFPPVQTGPGAHLASCKMGTGSSLGVKCGRGVLLTTHPLLVPRSWKSRAIPLPTLWATPGLQRENFTFIMFIEWRIRPLYEYHLQAVPLPPAPHPLLPFQKRRYQERVYKRVHRNNLFDQGDKREDDHMKKRKFNIYGVSKRHKNCR